MTFGAGVLLVLIGTVTYALGEGWGVVDALYFAVATLTTTSVPTRISCSTSPG